MSLPLVTISIPAYKPEFFDIALKSAIGQSYSNIEIIVSDDCPDDRIASICSKYNNITYERHTQGGHMNQLDILYLGSGRFIKPLFDDDVLHPFCVERMVNSLLANTEASFCFSASAVIDGLNQISNKRRPFQQSGIISGENIKSGLIKSIRNFIGEFSTIMIKRDALNRIPKEHLFYHWGTDFSRGLADVACYLNLANNNSSTYLDEELSYFRKDPKLSSNSNFSVNDNFIFCITHWIDFLTLGSRNGFITKSEAYEALPRVRAMIKSWINVYPSLNINLTQYESHLENLT